MKTVKLIVSGAVLVILVTGVLLLAAQQQKSLPTNAPPTKPLNERKPAVPSSTPSISAPVVGTPTATPAIITVGTPITVNVTVQITGVTPLPGGVNLLELGPTGTQPTILGVMQSVGNRMYSLQNVFNETTPGQVQLEVSAAFPGLLRRVVSSPVNVAVWETFSDAASGITLAFPSFAPSEQVLLVPPNGGPVTGYDLEVYDNTSEQFVSLIGMTIYPNTNHLSLQQWFAKNVDVNNILGSSNAYQQIILPNGINALILARQVPAAYLKVSGPVAEGYALASSADRVISIMQSQELQVSQFGYNTNVLFEQILGEMQFP